MLERLCDQHPDASEIMNSKQLDYLWRAISRTLGIIRFEIEAHEIIDQGGTQDDLDAARLKAFHERLGEGVEIDERMGADWRSIEQIYLYPFSCISYPLGALSALSLFGQYQDEGRGAANSIIEMFQLGGSQNPREIFAATGVDICKDGCWDHALMAVEQMVQSFEDS